MPAMTAVATLVMTEPSVLARLARSSASSPVPRLSSCSNLLTSRWLARTSAQARVAMSEDSKPVIECPVGDTA